MIALNCYKKVFLYLLFSLPGLSSAKLEKAVNTCDIASRKRNLMEGSLSDYWAQKLIGADLMREELEKIPPPEIENWITLIDHEKRNRLAKSLISGEEAHTILPKLNAYLNPRNFIKDISAISLHKISDPVDFNKRPPRYISNSMDWKESENIYSFFKELAGFSTPIIILSSRSDFRYKLDKIKRKAVEELDVILVGSFTDQGFVSEFSQSGREVSILAPFDYWIDSKVDENRFKETLGSVSLVTGSLAGFEWLSGYQPTAKEAKILLEKTALPTPYSAFEKPRINGAGLLNAYKIGEVAKRLKENCKNKDCISVEILKDENYHFDKDETLIEDLKKAFPSCGGISKPPLNDCEAKKNLFNRLRKETLLNPTRENLDILSCMYKSSGFSGNAMVLNSLWKALGTEGEMRANIKSIISKESVIPDSVFRLAVGMGGFEDSFTSLEFQTALLTRYLMGELDLHLLMKAFNTNDFELQKMSLSLVSGEDGLPLLERAFNTGNLELQKQALQAAGKIGAVGLSLLERPFTINYRAQIGLQQEAVDSVDWKKEESIPFLKKLLKTENLNENIEKSISEKLRKAKIAN